MILSSHFSTAEVLLLMAWSAVAAKTTFILKTVQPLMVRLSLACGPAFQKYNFKNAHFSSSLFLDRKNISALQVTSGNFAQFLAWSIVNVWLLKEKSRSGLILVVVECQQNSLAARNGPLPPSLKVKVNRGI